MSGGYKKIIFVGAIIFSALSFAMKIEEKIDFNEDYDDKDSVTFKVEYEDALNRQIFKSEVKQPLPQSKNGEIAFSDPKMRKTVLIIELLEAMKKAVKRSNTTTLEKAIEQFEEALRVHKEIADNWNDKKHWKDVANMARKLVENIKKKDCVVYEQRKTRGIRCKGISQPYNLSSGGAQSGGKFWDTIENGGVPGANDINIGGFLKEFDLSLEGLPCNKGEVCFGAGIAVDEDNGTVWLQIAAAAEPTKEQLKRRPLNLALVVDISGSMGIDNRIEWAKDAVNSILDFLEDGDYISLFAFDHKVLRLHQSEAYNNHTKENIQKNSMPLLRPTGATDLSSALERGFNEVLQQKINLDSNYEHKVILISDAQANRGETSQMGINNLVQQYALKGIGLITFGIGSQTGNDTGFNQDLIDAINQSRGGSYEFVSSLYSMKRAIKRLPQLVKPFVYNVNGFLKGLPGYLTEKRIYGTEAKENQKPKIGKLLSIPTYFLTEAEDGGGAVVIKLKYQSAKNWAVIKGSDDRTRVFKAGREVTLLLEPNGYEQVADILSIDDKGNFSLRITRLNYGESNAILKLNHDQKTYEYITKSMRFDFGTPSKICTFKTSGTNFLDTKKHGEVYCISCQDCSEETNRVCCPYCDECHRGHNKELVLGIKDYYCDCGADELDCQKVHPVFGKKCLALEKVQVKSLSNEEIRSVAIPKIEGGYMVLVKGKSLSNDGINSERMLDIIDNLLIMSPVPMLLTEISKQFGDDYWYFSVNSKGDTSKIERWQKK